jgi:predicted outer membrane lipoprotein
MENNPIIGFSVLLFIYAFFSWSLGRFINKRKQKEVSEFQHFLTGAWILGLLIALMIGIKYYYTYF